MQPNPDPKPGRWILPVVILAMMGFAWLFINAAEDPTVSATETTVNGGSGATTTTTTLPPSGTTTTTVPADILQYNVDITNAGIAMAGLQETINDANNNWEDRTVLYADTVTILQGLDADVKAWRAGLNDLVVPSSLPEYADFHNIMIAAAAEVVRTSSAIVPGLQAPDTGEARRAAVSAFNGAVTAYGNQVNTIAAYRPGTTS
ncbi:MAG: hypothetical protein HKO63_01595 [Acidimicrobiia bacterium]|nr:hypothetical protein [Acidimicrobiia bacterium]MBT8192037.1 hypothetical protein [Acidimicrobiia bacterium]MBT8248128.1 hypothetical protein [Acidimicrobiia bacterium]NNF88052.1 hypothetical protein [Acidimicrobiia bacterium]NNJ47356.1 hypothetical protein [Acidimicrobiia bacterium]